MADTREINLNDKALWDPNDLRAAGVGSRTTIWRLLRDDPSFPRPVMVRGLPRFVPAEIRDWIQRAPRAERAA